MPLHAQGSITVRRRPKDGSPGADAVRYWLVPSVSQIKKTDSGTYYPISVSCEKRKQTGNSSPIATSEGTLKYQIGYTDSSVTNLANYSTAITVPANCQWIKFVLYVNNVDVASETVTVNADGADVYLLDLDNEMQGIPCISSGTPTGTGALASTNATVYKGSKVDSGWTFSKTDTGCTSSIDTSTGTVSVTAISADKASVKVTATKGTQTLSATMSLYKVKAGASGVNPVVYSIEVSSSSISRDKSGTLNPTSITAYQNKTVGNTTSRTSDKTLKYLREGQDTTETALANQGGEIKGLTASCTAVVITLYDGTTILDKERVPIVKDGSDGKDGQDVCLLDLDNEVEGIPCNSSGTPTITGTLATTNSTVYKGSKVDTGWTFSKVDDGCTSSINATTGTVSVTAISADKASVKVTATKGTQTLSATMSLYKVKPGTNGSSPVVYSIEVSASAVSRDKSGTLNPTSITAYKNKTVGNSTARTSEKTIKYKREGQDTSEITLSGEGGTINGFSSACTGVLVTIYDSDGTTVLDKERVPVVKDGSDGADGENGKDGEDGVTILISPENVEFNFSKSEAERLVRVDVYAGKKKLVYGTGFTCSSLSSNSTLAAGLVWSFGTDSKGFFYKLTYAAGNVVELSVPFTVTVDGVQYSKSFYVSTVKNGEPGQQGIQGCVYRQTVWKDNVEYRNDSELVTNGVRYIDIVLIEDLTVPARYRAFTCILTHTSSPSNNPMKEFADLGSNGGNQTQHWEKYNELAPIHTPFIFADGGVIRLMQSNQILISEDVLNPSSLSVYKNKTVGSTLTRTSEMTLTYQRIGQDKSPITVTDTDCTIRDLSLDCTAIELKLYNGTSLLDNELVPIVDEGSDRYTLLLDNKRQGIPCNSSGTPTGSGTLASANFKVYKGSQTDTGWSFSREASGCTASINATTGVISVTAMNADTASVKITATKGANTLSAVMSLYKSKAVSSSASPVVYSIDKSANVIIRNIGGNITAGFSGSTDGSQIRIWAGSSVPDEAPFRVDSKGKMFASDAEIEGSVMAGTPNGQRVELQPGNKAMKVYDGSGVETASFEGNTYTSLSGLFSNKSGSFAMNGNNKGSLSLAGSDSKVSDYTLMEYRASSAVESGTPIEVVVSGFLQTYCTDPEPVSTSPQTDGGNGTSTNKYASANLDIFVYTYSDAALTKKVGSALVASCSGKSDKTISGARAKTSVGGFHVIVVRAHLLAIGSGQSASAKWGSAVSGKSDISATYTTDFYVSRYFANGFCLGRSTANYIWAYNQGTAGMRFVMENNGYGLDFSNQGIKYKHHSGNWIGMPMLVFKGRAQNSGSGSSTVYSWSSSATYNSDSPTLSRVSEGRIKVSFPSSWINAGITPAGCMINVVGYGVNSGGSFPVKAQILEMGSDYVTVTLSDDETTNDGSFMIQIYTT